MHACGRRSAAEVKQGRVVDCNNGQTEADPVQTRQAQGKHVPDALIESRPLVHSHKHTQPCHQARQDLVIGPLQLLQRWKKEERWQQQGNEILKLSSRAQRWGEEVLVLAAGSWAE